MVRRLGPAAAWGQVSSSLHPCWEDEPLTLPNRPFRAATQNEACLAREPATCLYALPLTVRSRAEQADRAQGSRTRAQGVNEPLAALGQVTWPPPSLSFLSDQSRVIPPPRIIGSGEVVVWVRGGIPAATGDRWGWTGEHHAWVSALTLLPALAPPLSHTHCVAGARSQPAPICLPPPGC